MNSSFRLRGFTLIELSVVLVVLALLAGAALSIATQQTTQQKTLDLKEGFDGIEEALLAYRKTYNRLPCPADPTLATTHANFGVENGVAGTCANLIGTTNTVYGALPVKALGLPDDKMFDAWGRKYRYLVDKRITETDAFIIYSITDSTIGDISVRDSIGQNITTKAIYAVISHGKNGHGAYTRNGAAFSSGSSNTDEQNNCDCNATGTYVSPGAFSSIVIKPFTSDPTNALNVFDDFGIYKLRFQLLSPEEQESSVDTPYDGPEFYSASLLAPGLITYSLNKVNKISAREANIAPPLPGVPYAIAIDKSNRYVVVGYSNGNRLSVYRQDGVTLTKLAEPANPGDHVRGLSFSKNSDYLAVATQSINAMVYKHYDGNLVLLSGTKGPQSTVATGSGVALSSDGTYLAAVCSTAPYLYIYKRDGNDAYNLLPNPVSMPVRSSVYTEFSDDDKYLMVTTTGLGAQISLYIYERSGDTFTLLTGANGPQTDPNYTYQTSFSENADYLAVTDSSSPYIWVYKRSGNTFTAITTGPNANGFDVIPTASPRGAQFTKDNKFLILGNPNSGSTGALVYERNGDSFTKLSDPTGTTFGAPNTISAIATVN